MGHPEQQKKDVEDADEQATELSESGKKDNASDASDKEGAGEHIPREVLDQLPPEVRKFASMQISSISGPRQNPLVSKINEAHIDKILDLAGQDDERTHSDVRSARKYNLVYTILALLLFIFITWFLAKSDSELYKEILKLFAVFAGGFGGGFGVKAYIDRKKF